jgi:hypothetical protein
MRIWISPRRWRPRDLLILDVSGSILRRQAIDVALWVIDGCDDGLCATDGMPLTADAPLQRGELAKSAICGLL